MSAEPVTIERYPTAEAFLRALGPWLLERETETNVMFSVAELLAAGDHPFKPPFYYAGIESSGRLVGCALRAPPDGLGVSALPPGVAEQLAADVAEQQPDLQGVSGPDATAAEFARAWVAARGGTWRIRYEWTLFRLESVVSPRRAAGRLRLSEPRDWPALRAWAPRYARDVNAPLDVERFFGEMARRDCLYVWDDDGARCVVAMSGRTQNGRRVSAVYTPDEFRRRGYAANAVAAACEIALGDGASFCVLFADREPSLPSRVYRRVGFEPIEDHLVIDLLR